MVDDLSLMMRSFRSTQEFAKTRSARFQLHPTPSADEFDGIWREERSHGWFNYLEELMKEIPGYRSDIIHISQIIPGQYFYRLTLLFTCTMFLCFIQGPF